MKRPNNTTTAKTRTDRSLFFKILMSPVTKEPKAEIPKAKIAIRATNQNRPDSPAYTLLELKTRTNTKDKMKVAARPTDHQPNEVFGSMIIRIFITSIPNISCQDYSPLR